MWNNGFARVQSVALANLDPADRNQFLPFITHPHASGRIDFDGPLWVRWESAFAEAVAETGCPIAITATDILL
jgi:hypothetical protein